MKYQFRGYVYGVEPDHYFLVMNDVTDRTQPSEAWTVEKTFVSRPLDCGDYINFTVTDRGGRFSFPRLRRWTKRDLARIHKRAREISAIFGSEPPSDPAEVSGGTTPFDPAR